MGEKDISEKLLADYEDVFADIVNVLLFHGEKRVIPSSLQSTKTGLITRRMTQNSMNRSGIS